MKKPEITELEWESCPDCPDRGWYVSGNPVGSQSRCQFCYQKENSVFNQKLLMMEMIDALIEADTHIRQIREAEGRENEAMKYVLNKTEQALKKAGVQI